MSKRRSRIGFVALALAGALTLSPAVAQDSGEATYRDIQQTLGVVPGFFKQFPAVGVAGAWQEFKTVQLNPKTELSGK